MEQEIVDYLTSQRIAVLAVEMPDGSPHAATVHFAFTQNPLIFLFETDRNYRKSEALFGRAESRASLVVGFSEIDKKTLQLDGFVRLIKPEEKSLIDTYLLRFPEKQKKSSNPNYVSFMFIPTWWRWSDFSQAGAKKIITS